MQTVQTMQATRGTTPRRVRRSGSVAESVEQRLEKPVFYSVLLVLVLRSATVFSGGILNLHALLGVFWFDAFQIVTGLGLALGSEMLMSLAGRSWRYWRKQETELAGTPGLSRIQRVSRVNEARANARISYWFMLIGAAASVGSGVWYLISNGGDAALDVAICIVITAVVLYLGVLRETKRQDSAEAALADLDAGMDAALMTAVERFRENRHTEQDIRFITEHLPPHRQGRFRRAVAKADGGRMWNAAQIREGLGVGADQTQVRAINRQINALAKEPQNGLAKDAAGRWLIPNAVVQDVWGEAMADYRAMARIGAAAAEVRTADGQAHETLSAAP